MGSTPSLLMSRRKVVGNHWSHALESGLVDSHFAIGQESILLRHLQTCTRVWVGKTPPLLMGRRKVVCNTYTYVLELGWVTLPPCRWS